LTALALVAGPSPAAAQTAAGGPEAGERQATEAAIAQLPARHRAFLQEVDLLLSAKERAAFLALEKDYQRDAFTARFWRSRDPFPETGRNEFRERWEERMVLAQDRFTDLSDDRARMLLYNGEPEQSEPLFCSELLRPLEVWQYSGTELIRTPFALVFYSHGGSRGRYRLWYPSQGLQPLLQGALPFARGADPGSGDSALAELIERNCTRGESILAALSGAADWGRVEDAVAVVPDPGDEWLDTFLAYSTDLPEGADTFEADLAVSFPGRQQSRTVVQGLVTVPVASLAASAEDTAGEDTATQDTAEPPTANATMAGEAARETARPRAAGFLLDGEVLRQGELFEHFRYRFPLHVEDAVAGRLPLVFQRNLRPGSYRLIVKLEELSTGRFFRQHVDLEVPSVERLAAARAAGTGAVGVPGAPVPSAEPARRLGEANSALRDRDYSIEIFRPPARLLVGKTRFEAVARGEEIARVRFELDGRPVLSKTRPPYSVELDLGRAPRLHRLRALALDTAGEVLAADEVTLNAGPHRFAVRLVEPRSGAQYVESLRASAVVEVPEGEQLDRVEFFFNDERISTLYGPPFVQPILLPPGAGDVDYVRVVAYLVDGNLSEDTVIVNASAAGAELNVRTVELFTTVVDRKGRPVEGLTAENFTVLEEGVEQTVRRFERVEEVPIYAGLLLDTSRSMLEAIGEVVSGALSFFDTVLRPQDRAAVITFNEEPSLVVRFTNDREVLAGGVAGLVAEGETALYDSLIYALYYFSEIRGKRALILLSDGADVESRYSYQDAVEFARRTGVTIYAVGLGLSSRQDDVRLKLTRLAAETGGQAFFISEARELDRIYRLIEDELRSQYLLVYQSSLPADAAGGRDEERFREVEVKVDRPGTEAKTIRGYYP
jgi:Ca-activated chloride channel family protein